jgi:hypothetical protein
MDRPSIQIVLLDVLEVLGRNSAQDLVNFVIYAILLQVLEQSRGGADREIVENGYVFVLEEYLLVLVSFDNGLLGEDFVDLMQA